MSGMSFQKLFCSTLICLCLYINDPTEKSHVICLLTYLSTAKQGDNALGSVHLFVCLSVCLFVCPTSPVWTVSSSMKQKWKEQRRVIISPRCLSVCRLSCADAVDRLLITNYDSLRHYQDPPCNAQLKTSFSKMKDSFIWPILCHVIIISLDSCEMDFVT